MARARQETCPHPAKRIERVAYGRYRCARCDTDLTPVGRGFTVKHSERTTFYYGDLVKVTSGAACGPFTGIFLYTEETPSGTCYVIAEVQRVGNRSGWAGLYTVRPEYVKTAPGLRERRRREEHTTA